MSADEKKRDDRRRETRLDIELWVAEVAGDDVVYRRTGNVSASGVYFQQAIPHEVGSELKLKLPLLELDPPAMVIATGKVVRPSAEEDGLGMGVEFVEFEGEGESHLRRYLDSIAQAKSPA